MKPCRTLREQRVGILTIQKGKITLFKQKAFFKPIFFAGHLRILSHAEILGKVALQVLLAMYLLCASRSDKVKAMLPSFPLSDLRKQATKEGI